MLNLFSLLQLKRSSRVIGLCYVVVKVALLLVIEILAFPVICGWWLDIWCQSYKTILLNSPLTP
jgi:hypothetical protein